MVVEQDRRPEEQQPQRSPLEQLFEALDRAGQSSVIDPGLAELEIAYMSADHLREYYGRPEEEMLDVVTSLMDEDILPGEYVLFGEFPQQRENPIAARVALQALANIGVLPEQTDPYYYLREQNSLDTADLIVELIRRKAVILEESREDGEVAVYSCMSNIPGVGVSIEIPVLRLQETSEMAIKHRVPDFSLVAVTLQPKAYVASFGQPGK